MLQAPSFGPTEKLIFQWVGQYTFGHFALMKSYRRVQGDRHKFIYNNGVGYDIRALQNDVRIFFYHHSGVYLLGGIAGNQC